MGTNRYIFAIDYNGGVGEHCHGLAARRPDFAVRDIIAESLFLSFEPNRLIFDGNLFCLVELANRGCV